MFIRKLSLVAATVVALGLVGCSGAEPQADDGVSSEDALSGQERAAVMNGLRAKVGPTFPGQDILFNVSGPNGVLRSAGRFAWLQGTVQLRNGAEPSLRGTIYAEWAAEGMLDGFHIEALLEKTAAGWTVREHGVGSTDVWFDGIDERFPAAPKSIFPWKDGGTVAAPTERMAIMNGLRATVKPELANQDIVFNVSQGSFQTAGGFAWVSGNIELRGGGIPTIRGTAYEGAPMDGFSFGALLQKQGSAWTVLEHDVGSTDVWYVGIAARHPSAPEAIFPSLGR